jgi:hypothetical protein
MLLVVGDVHVDSEASTVLHQSRDLLVQLGSPEVLIGAGYLCA